MIEWFYELKGIKELLQQEATIETTIELCSSLIKQLRVIQNNVEKRSFDEDAKYIIDNELETIISNFEFVKDLLNGTIPEEDWDDYDFDLSQREELFNDYLTGLYDLADEKFQLKNGRLIKFIWVG